MNELILIRHGQAEHLINDISGGWTDTKLTELGKKQARFAGSRLKEFLDSKGLKIYSSDLSRALETAEIISSIMYIEFSSSKDLRELNTGKAINLTQTEADRIRQPMTEPLLDWIPYPEGESWRMMHTRIKKFMESLDIDESETVLLVTHGGPLIVLVHIWLELPEEFFSKVSYQFDPCSITRLGINKHGEKTIYNLNDTAHLTKLMQ